MIDTLGWSAIGEAEVRLPQLPVSGRIVGQIEWDAGELFPRVWFVVTNLNFLSSCVVRHAKYFPFSWRKLLCDTGTV